MHLVYVDDSGDSRHGTTLTALIVPDDRWNEVMAAWLGGRRAIHHEFGIPTTRELHANELYKGRGKYCETEGQERLFSTPRRAATGRIMLSALAAAEGALVVTIATPCRSSTESYNTLLRWLDGWAEENDTTVMVFYDGQQGYGEPCAPLSPAQARAEWDTALRASTPYRKAHRALDLHTRRVIEDVIMQDSRYNQLIQATDLIAYGAYQLHAQTHPEIWGATHRPVTDAIRAYRKMAPRWLPTSEHGIIWCP
ncbi:hypothetical protein CWC38_10545 [Kocuria tytonicola]|uniref:DUF3800 domain-containing protein n=1 Tax=Kocuria tytonicola TaxID=2055946 RepID=UPI000EF94E58|nr:DUF3800 domain-containing protein [Kocuria tytonicola]RLZ02548.1 hypothetical protein CWC38_10545 [Kocuria tytonicola]